MHEQRARALQASTRNQRFAANGPRASVRRVVGRSMVRIGARLAGEPAPRPARSM